MWKNLNETNANSNTTNAADVASDLIGKDVQAALSVDLHRSLQTKLGWWWKKVDKKRMRENATTIKRNLLLGETEHSDATTNDSREAARVRNILA